MTKSGSNPSASSSLNETGHTLLADESPAQRDEDASADEQIRMRAYELHLERGDQPGDQLGDWLRAEREYRERRAASDGAVRCSIAAAP
jgi:hypothetical protein